MNMRKKKAETVFERFSAALVTSDSNLSYVFHVKSLL